MCIRDSRKEALMNFPLSAFVAVSASNPWTYVLFGVIGFASVSYTHLRAHETVLDLVCRLLLEKKHNNT